MAQLNITLNQEEILQLLSNNPGAAFTKMLQDSLNSILKAESTAQLKAEPYERTEERTASRNGYRDKPYTTRIGTIDLHVPKHRDGEPFHTMLFNNYNRSESALILVMAEMVVNGVSTRKVAQVMELLCGKTYSKSTVSQACKSLDKNVKEFKERRLTCQYPFLTVDATYFKVRENMRVVSKAFMIAYATTCDGVREIIGFNIYARESKETWNDFLESLKKRGLSGVRMITSDANEGIINAICNHFPEAAWQRCQFHFSRNIIDKTPNKYQAGLASELREMFDCKTIEEARKRRDEIIHSYSDVAESAMSCLDNGFESSMSVMVLNPYLRQYFRTSNHIERVNRELKRRSNVIGVFPNEDSLMRLMGSVLLEMNDANVTRKHLFREKYYKSVIAGDVSLKLITIAQEQRQLLMAMS